MLEVLVAITILSIGILGVAGLTIGIIRGNYVSKNATTATVIAESRLEVIRRDGYASAAAKVESDTGVIMSGTTYSRDTTVADATPEPNMRTVTVQVSWNNDAGSVTLKTILAQ